MVRGREHMRRKFLLHLLPKLSPLATAPTKPWGRTTLGLTQHRHLHDFNKWHKPFFIYYLLLKPCLIYRQTIMATARYQYQAVRVIETPILGDVAKYNPVLLRVLIMIYLCLGEITVPSPHSIIWPLYILIFQKWLIISSEVIKRSFHTKKKNLRKHALNPLIKYKENVLAAYINTAAIKCKFTPIFLLFRWTWARRRNKVLCSVIAQFDRIHELVH